MSKPPARFAVERVNLMRRGRQAQGGVSLEGMNICQAHRNPGFGSVEAAGYHGVRPRALAVIHLQRRKTPPWRVLLRNRARAAYNTITFLFRQPGMPGRLAWSFSPVHSPRAIPAGRVFFRKDFSVSDSLLSRNVRLFCSVLTLSARSRFCPRIL